MSERRMVVIGGVRYRVEDARRLGILPPPPSIPVAKVIDPPKRRRAAKRS